MKSWMSTYMPLAAVAGMLMLSNCSGKRSEERADTETQTDTGTLYEADDAFKKQLGNVFASYVELKDAFVATDAAAVTQEIPGFREALGQVDASQISGEAHDKWMEYLNGMDAALKEMDGTDDIEAQRESFSMLSDNFYQSLKAFGTGGITAYHQYCPMAFDDRGAYWLSDEKQISNPYFGDKMLRCGSVKETLQ